MLKYRLLNDALSEQEKGEVVFTPTGGHLTKDGLAYIVQENFNLTRE